jgi:hypothetical protein
MESHSRAGVTQLVECNLAKVDVAGSNPVSRSIPSRTPIPTTGHLSISAVGLGKMVAQASACELGLIPHRMLAFAYDWNWQPGCLSGVE